MSQRWASLVFWAALSLLDLAKRAGQAGPIHACYARHSARQPTPSKVEQSALEEASARDSTAKGQARPGSKLDSKIPGFGSRAAHGTLLERHAGQHISSSPAARNEEVPGRPQPQAGTGADYLRHGLAMDGRQEDMSNAGIRASFDDVRSPRDGAARGTSPRRGISANLMIDGCQTELYIALMERQWPIRFRAAMRTIGSRSARASGGWREKARELGELRRCRAFRTRRCCCECC